MHVIQYIFFTIYILHESYILLKKLFTIGYLNELFTHFLTSDLVKINKIIHKYDD